MNTNIDTTSRILKDIHKHNDQFYNTQAPFHPALLVQDPTLDIKNASILINLLQRTTKEKIIRLASTNKKISNFFQNQKDILLKNPLPKWATILSRIPILAQAAFASLDFKELGNFVLSIGTGPNLYVVPHITTFHIAIINQKNNVKISPFALIRPEILIVLNNLQLVRTIERIRKNSLGKPTLSITKLDQLRPILQKAVDIYNNMPFRWSEELRNIKSQQ